MRLWFWVLFVFSWGQYLFDKLEFSNMNIYLDVAILYWNYTTAILNPWIKFLCSRNINYSLSVMLAHLTSPEVVVSCKKNAFQLLACSHSPPLLSSWCEHVQAIGEFHTRNDTSKVKPQWCSNWICSTQCYAGVQILVCTTLSGAFHCLLEPTNFLVCSSASHEEVIHISVICYFPRLTIDEWRLALDVVWNNCYWCLCIQADWSAGCRDMLHTWISVLNCVSQVCESGVCVTQYHNHDLRWYSKRELHSRHDEHTVQWQSHCQHYGTND